MQSVSHLQIATHCNIQITPFKKPFSFLLITDPCPELRAPRQSLSPTFWVRCCSVFWQTRSQSWAHTFKNVINIVSGLQETEGEWGQGKGCHCQLEFSNRPVMWNTTQANSNRIVFFLGLLDSCFHWALWLSTYFIGSVTRGYAFNKNIIYC